MRVLRAGTCVYFDLLARSSNRYAIPSTSFGHFDIGFSFGEDSVITA